MSELISAIDAGAAAVILTGEGVEWAATSRSFAAALESQPDWSDLPLILLPRHARGAQARRLPAVLASAVLVPTPADEEILLRVVSAALRRRQRQHTVAERLARISRANHELSDSVRAKDELLAMLAHELRNPLSALQTASRLLGSDRASPVTINLASDVVGRQVAQMARLLDDLLDVARIRLNRLELRREVCEVASIVRSAVEATQPLMDAKAHALKVELPEQKIEIVADPARLSQVITNLLANSARYTEPAGQIGLRLWQEAAQVAIEVRDNGIGIPPESLNAVFGMFAQLPAARPRAKTGLGIGLSLVRGIVELHGGTVQAFSEGENRGSVFTVFLPTGTPGPGASPSSGVSVPTHSGCCNILLADDDADAREVLAALLRIEGHTIYLAKDGGEALKIASERSLDVLILDVTMPGLSGYEVARHLRANGLIARDARLIALTGWTRVADRSDALAAGFDHHLKKPVDVEALRKLLSAKST
jgi:signal transduction histidine kinase